MARRKTLVWRGAEVDSRITAEIHKRQTKAVRMLEGDAKEHLSETGKGSKPGEYPQKQTGHGRRNIASESDKQTLTARWGTNVIYFKWLEFGARYMLPRPWMMLTNERMMSAIRKMLERPME